MGKPYRGLILVVNSKPYVVGSRTVNRIRELREARGLTREDLARLLGVSISSVVGWEQGAIPRRRNAVKLAKRLGVTVEDLAIEEARDV